MTGSLGQAAEDFLGGSVAGAMAGYEIREPQKDMMRAVAGVIEDGGRLIVEAGTGTGKTFAYLIPSILSAKRTVISTRTINLQEQLYSKDLAFLSTLYPFSYAIAKGRGNYICLRRLHAFSSDDAEEMQERRDLLGWTGEDGTGDIGDYGLRNRPSIWDRVSSDPDACSGKRCSFLKDCRYFGARRRWEEAQVVVTNHALLTINAMMPADNRLIPDADILVIDEGHTLDSIVSGQTGMNLSERGLGNILNLLLKTDHRGVYKGLLAKTPSLFRDVETLRHEAGLFWARAGRELEHRKRIRGSFMLADELRRHSDSIRSLLEAVRTTPMGLFTEDEELDLRSALNRLRSFSEGVEIFQEETEGFVRWADVEEGRSALRMAPIYASEFVRSSIVPDYSSLVLTSATLSVSGDFSLIQETLGLGGAETLSLPSPFDLQRQVEVAVKRGIDLRRDEGIEKLAGVIVQESLTAGGGTLVLFTSREVMRKTWDLASGGLAAAGLNPMVQGDLPNRKMLEAMRKSRNTVLFGLDSFWEGVDVRGDALACLIITKLPFEVPTEPIVQARTDEIRKRGGDPFRDYSLPRAVLKFRQGFGRLIRSKDDRGRVIICDGRVETREYGKLFLKSIL